MYLWKLDMRRSWQWKSVRKYGTLDLHLNIHKYICIHFHIILDNQFQLDYRTKFKWKNGNNWSGDNFPSPWLGLTCNLWHWTVIFPRSAEPDLSPDRKRIFLPNHWLGITALCWDEDQVSWQQSSQTYLKNYAEKRACSSNKGHIHLLKQNCRAVLHWTANAWESPAKRTTA